MIKIGYIKPDKQTLEYVRTNLKVANKKID